MQLDALSSAALAGVVPCALYELAVVGFAR